MGRQAEIRRRYAGSPPRPSDDRFTYRFVKNGRASEVHAETAEDLLRRATDHLEAGLVLPVHIRQGRRIVYDLVDITDAWEKRYLQ